MIDDRFYSMRGIGKVDSGIPSVMPDNLGSIVSIVVDTPPTKTTYYAGDSIDLRGMVILGVYSDDSTVDITRWCTVQVRQPLALSSTTPVVWFESLSTTFSIVVTGRPVAVPSSAVHIFHFDGNGYDALGNLGLGDQESGTPELRVYAYDVGCVPRMGLSSTGAKLERIAGQSQYESYGYIKTPSQYELLKNNKSITIAFWTKKPLTFVYGMNNNSGGYGSGEVRYWKIEVGLSSIAMRMSTGSGIYYSGEEGLGAYIDCSGAISFDTNEWHHVAMVVDGARTMYAFFDGQLVCSADLSQTTWGTTGGSLAQFFTGDNVNIDEMIFASSALWTSSFVPPTGPYNA